MIAEPDPICDFISDLAVDVFARDGKRPAGVSRLFSSSGSHGG